MPTNVLSIVQEVCRRVGVPRPNAIVSSTDNQVGQLLGLLNKLPEDLWTRRSTLFGGKFISTDTGLVDRVVKDSDTFTLPDPIPLNWLEWKWKSEKGLDYAESFNLYERVIAAWVLANNAGREVDLTGGARGYDVRSINQGWFASFRRWV